MRWFPSFLSRRGLYDELSESIREHLDEKVADLMDRGMTREQAESTARREFGYRARIVTDTENLRMGKHYKIQWLSLVEAAGVELFHSA